jgi:serine/threonine-protein kinase
MNREVGVDVPALPASAPTLSVPGEIIEDKYRLEAVVGRGGMSVVYRATHLKLGQLVAIKVLSAAALVLPEYVIRLEREARACSQIRSEHVARVFDIGKLPGSGIPYLVMEHLDGADLAATLARRGPLPVELAVDAVVQACEALAEAHALGIVHRDLKPANLFLTESVDGSPCIKVLDFGISRMIERSPRANLTDPGTVLGTPSYMAPEQMEGTEPLDARSDIWALGTILFELLVGRPPWTGESLPQIFVKIMREKTPRPSLHRPGIPAAIDAVVARCLAIEPEDRWPSVAELAQALSELGSARARDSAERASRVWEKRRSESGTAAVLPPRAEARRASTRAISQLALTLAAGIAIGAFAIAIQRPRTVKTSPPSVVAPVAPVEEAVVITPLVHPHPQPEPQPLALEPTAAVVRAITPPPRSAEARRPLPRTQKREPPSLAGASLATASTPEH